MARTLQTACRVLLVVYGSVWLSVSVAGRGGGSRRPASLWSGLNQQLCSILSNCTSLCENCDDRSMGVLFDSLNNCDSFENTEPEENNTSFRYVYRCPQSSSYKYALCMCTDSTDISNKQCKRCNNTEENNALCFSKDNGDIHVWTSRNSSILLDDACPSCSCSTNAPTTPMPPTTTPSRPTIRFADKVDPKPDPSFMTTSAGAIEGPNESVIIAVAATGGGALVILIIVCCVCCYQKKCRNKPNMPDKEQEYAYIDIQEMRSLRSQASMMNGQQLMSSQGNHPPCGHRNFHNELYGLNGIGNGSTLPPDPPTLPGNHPQPSRPPPDAYQELNRGRVSTAAARKAMGSGPCPHCRRMVGEKSATAPLLDRPSEAEGYQQGVEGARNPYMALMKNNTAPSPGTPPGEPLCKCHARPLSECSSIAESVNSERTSRALGTLGSTGHESDQRPLSGSSDVQESPYYFKMEVPAGAPEPSPKSPQYFKLEDAETLPLDSENAPMLPDPDTNGNNVLIKPLSKDKDSKGTCADRGLSGSLEKQPCLTSQSQDSGVPTDVKTAPTSQDEGRQSPGRTPSPDPQLGKSPPEGTHSEGLSNGDYMHLVTGQ